MYWLFSFEKIVKFLILCVNFTFQCIEKTEKYELVLFFNLIA